MNVGGTKAISSGPSMIMKESIIASVIGAGMCSPNNDLDLLISAAYGLRLTHVDYSEIDYDGKHGIMLTDSIGRHLGMWDPINDDGDALKAAVMLAHIDEGFHDIVWSWTHRDVRVFAGGFEGTGDDMYEKVRRAIVLAAARYGKTLMEKNDVAD